MKVTNKGYGQQDIGIYRSEWKPNPAVTKQDHEISVGNTEVRHFTCQSCSLPFSMNMPPGSTKAKSKLMRPGSNISTEKNVRKIDGSNQIKANNNIQI